MQVRKHHLELNVEQAGSKWGKEDDKAAYCHPAYLTHIQSTTCKMPDWMKHKLESRFLGESEEKLKRLLMKVKKKSEKAGLRLNIQKTKITASGPITSQQIDGETMETGADFIFGLHNHCRW